MSEHDIILKRLTDKEKELEEIRNEFAEFKQDVEVYQLELENDNQYKDKEIEVLKNKLEGMKNKLDELKNENNKYSIIIEREKEKNNNCITQIEANKKNLVELEQRNDQLETENRNYQYEISELNEKLQTLEEKQIIQIEELSFQISLNLEEIQRLRDTNNELSDELQAVKNRNQIHIDQNHDNFDKDSSNMDTKGSQEQEKIEQMYKDQIHKLNEQLNNLTSELQAKIQIIASLEEEISELREYNLANSCGDTQAATQYIKDQQDFSQQYDSTQFNNSNPNSNSHKVKEVKFLINAESEMNKSRNDNHNSISDLRSETSTDFRTSTANSTIAFIHNQSFSNIKSDNYLEESLNNSIIENHPKSYQKDSNGINISKHDTPITARKNNHHQEPQTIKNQNCSSDKRPNEYRKTSESPITPRITYPHQHYYYQQYYRDIKNKNQYMTPKGHKTSSFTLNNSCEMDTTNITTTTANTSSSRQYSPEKNSPLLTKNSTLKGRKFLFIKNDGKLPSTMAIRGNTISLKTNKTYISFGFDKIFQSIDTSFTRAYEEEPTSVFGRNFLYMVYGTKGTNKKRLKYKILEDFIILLLQAAKNQALKDCIARIVIKMEDWKLAEKTTNFAKKNSQFLEEKEFIINNEGVKDLINYINDLKAVDFQNHSSMQDKQKSKLNQVTQNHSYNQKSNEQKKTENYCKKIFLEFFIEQKIMNNSNNNPNISMLSSCPCQTNQVSVTKLMIITINKVYATKNLLSLNSISAILDYLISGDKDSALKKNFQELNGIQKHFIMTINTKHIMDKSTLDIMGFAEKIDQCLGFADKVNPKRNVNSSAASTNQGIKRSHNNRLPSREKIGNLSNTNKILNNSFAELSTTNLNNSGRFCSSRDSSNNSRYVFKD